MSSITFAVPLSVHIKSLLAQDKYAFWSAHYLARADEKTLAKIVPAQDTATQSSADNQNYIHNIGVGVLIAILGAAAVYLIRNHLGIPL